MTLVMTDASSGDARFVTPFAARHEIPWQSDFLGELVSFEAQLLHRTLWIRQTVIDVSISITMG